MSTAKNSPRPVLSLPSHWRRCELLLHRQKERSLPHRFGSPRMLVQLVALHHLHRGSRVPDLPGSLPAEPPSAITAPGSGLADVGQT